MKRVTPGGHEYDDGLASDFFGQKMVVDTPPDRHMLAGVIVRMERALAEQEQLAAGLDQRLQEESRECRRLADQLRAAEQEIDKMDQVGLAQIGLD